ncbi:MAG TPA: PAS domain S-box protein [Acidimicrobiales bacterium]|nr:PAS domain S-box protein [Acidimicrobiales bacterium]
MPDELTDEDLAGFLDLPTELFGVFDPRSGTAWCSPNVASVLGYEPHELERIDLSALVHPDDLGAPTTDVEEFPRDGAPLTLEVRCRAKDGMWHWLEWSGSWLDDQQRLFGAARDVSERHEAADRARANDRLVEAIVDHSTAAVFVKDVEGRFSLVNDAFLQLHGLDRGSVLGRRPTEIWGEDARASEEAEHRVVVTGTPMITDDVVVLGNQRHVLMTVRFPLLDPDGSATGVAAIATDVTELTLAERALADRERVLDTIFRACPDIVSVLDPQGQVQEVSRASTRILGYALGERSAGQLLPDLHPDDAKTVGQEFRRLLTLDQPEVDLRSRVRHADGRWVTLDTRAQALVAEDGQGAGAVLVSRDVSADLAVESELQAALVEAELANTAKSTFLSRMSHELRTPLNSILGFAQLLELEALDVQQHEAVRHVIRAGHHLLALIDEVLDIARIESGRLDLTLDPTPVLAVVDDAISFTRPLAEDRRIALVVDSTACPSDAHVLADRQRLLQVFLNLLSNGVKYNHEGGTLTVTVKQCGDRTNVVVRDTGPGIDPAEIHRVFAPFDRLGAERSAVPGTGVGLTLSKHLVEEMGGTIALESVPGDGAAFTVSMVSATAPLPPSSHARVMGPRRSQAGGLRVLHIEDNHANLELVEQVLARVPGVDLQAAMTGGLGLELARENRPDLVLLDLHLPDMAGVDVLGRLRSQPATADVPVVVVSADVTPMTVRLLRAEGVHAYLTKPIDVHELLRIVEALAAEQVG